jgi:NADPH:quinone reductase-like Zn-dependent oxidoreductase
MRAVVYERYGSPDVLELREVPTPVPASNEVLIRVHATTVSAADWRARSLAMPPGFGAMARLVFGVTRPRRPILGTELAGVIERIGPGVTRFKPGDAVFAYTGARMGAHGPPGASDARLRPYPAARQRCAPGGRTGGHRPLHAGHRSHLCLRANHRRAQVRRSGAQARKRGHYRHVAERHEQFKQQ